MISEAQDITVHEHYKLGGVPWQRPWPATSPCPWLPLGTRENDEHWACFAWIFVRGNGVKVWTGHPLSSAIAAGRPSCRGASSFTVIDRYNIVHFDSVPSCCVSTLAFFCSTRMFFGENALDIQKWYNRNFILVSPLSRWNCFVFFRLYKSFDVPRFWVVKLSSYCLDAHLMVTGCLLAIMLLSWTTTTCTFGTT
jgi:hypothetical protein